MKYLLITYSIILALGITSMITGIHYFANIAGFISAIGFMAVFFKDRDEEKEMTEEEIKAAAKQRQRWYIVFATGLFFSFIFGSLWNNQMGGMS